MEKEKIYLGSHVSLNSPEFYLGSVKEAISYGSTTFMFYTGAPQNTYRKPVEQLKIDEGRTLAKENGFDDSKIIVHAPYIINPANKLKPDLFELTKKTIISELQRTNAFGVKIMVLHPGAHVGQGVDIALDAVVECLDYVLENDHTDVKIALETMAGKGTEIGTTLEQLAYIINHSKYPNRLGVCFDTCHTHDGGYNIDDIENIIAQIEATIGLDKLLVIHLNDSKNPILAHKDRHENVGYGYIGFDTLCKYVHHPKLKDIPKILETPYFNEKPPYKEEIKMLLEGKYQENWRDKL